MGLSIFDVQGLSIFPHLRISNDGTKTTFLGKAGDYLRIGDAGTTGHSLNSEDDLLVTGDFEVDGIAYFDGGADLNGTELILDADADTSITVDTDDRIDLKIGGSDAWKITGPAATIQGYRYHDTAASAEPQIYLYRARGTEASPALVVDGDSVGSIISFAHDGAAWQDVALVSFEIDGTAAANDLPSRIVFKTTPDGTVAPAEAMRISQDKAVKMAGAFGMAAVTPQVRQAHIVDADGTLADITTKFNTLLADLEGYGMLATA